MKARVKRGNPFKRGNTWTFIYYVKDPETGQRKQKWKGGYRTKKEAAEALTLIKAQQVYGTHMEPKKMTFGDYANYFLDMNAHRLRDGTISNYRTTFRNNIDIIKDKAISEIDVQDILGIDKEMRKRDLKEATISTVHKQLKAVFNFAVKQDDLPNTPYRKFTVHQPPRRESTLPDVEGVTRLIEAAKSKGVLSYAIVLLGLTLGLRRGEITGLQYGDFDFKNRTVHIQRQIARKAQNGSMVTPLKTESSNRVIGVPEITLSLIEERLKEVESTDTDTIYVLTNTANHLSPITVRKYFKAVAVECGFPDMRLHDLRHAYATICLEKGVPLKVISDMLGHSSINITAGVYCERGHLKHESAHVMDNLLGEKGASQD